MLAANPFCVWFEVGKMRTFKTLVAATAFARRVGNGVIGQWSDEEGWWVELN